MASQAEVAGHGQSPKNQSDPIGLTLLAMDRPRVDRDADGEQFRNAATIPNARGRVGWCSAKDAVGKFRDKFGKLQDLAAEHGIGAIPMGLYLNKAGIDPIKAF